MIDLNQTLVVVRSANERTAKACELFLLNQGVRQENCLVLSKQPSSLAIKEAFQFALERKNKWLYRIDADILFHSKGLINFLNGIHHNKKNFVYSGFILCKFFGGIRSGGNYLYPQNVFNQAIELYPEYKDAIRPDNTLNNNMMQRGMKIAVVPRIVGIHDYYQSYKDIYRKSFMHGEKHLKYADYLVNYWKSKMAVDSDFDIALKGFSDSIMNTSQLIPDTKLPVFKINYERLKITEKEPLVYDEKLKIEIDEIIDNWELTDEYDHLFTKVLEPFYHRSTLSRFTSLVKSHNLFRAIFYYVGSKMLHQSGITRPNYIQKMK